ncbi:hypothetical protein PF005_g20460 [Phytophthora fragariae]|uniref:WRKY19-like zinc finger domain-containing protein n=1 Tax=Phytophthora fragariae TaxID=53985 RepID=A0A6A3J3K8_9STRA|nr:hypothetical protein PF009_g21471 [Phytophthora fragariae]KAE8988862.1 hypothetical protein PF011_g19006 [Phytophthora fragariae]KAE9116840.1 hypothetical protein PF006_g18947 [Phytophthora fragariae]KAE9187417.1 hypothetical protein PF005_g20460 [Phytophthora fragariae]KAE9199307.1 hypothetical protein PF004_g19307 [Phytophthora fragariae]
MDEDVEMEFISVMGVLVPIELTKCVSCEAKRFAAGDVSSNDEAPEIVEDPIPDTNLNHDVSTNSEHTETKCNHTGCTNFAETQGKGSEPTHCEVAEAKDTTVTIEDKSVDHKNDHVAAVGTQKSCLVGEVEVETGKLKGMAGSTQMTKKSQVKNHNGLRSEVRTQKTREKNRQQERGSKKCRGQEKERRPNVEPGVIDIKQSKRNPTKDEAKGNSPFDGMKQSTKSCKRKAQTVKTKVAVVQPTNVLESTSDAKEKPTAANSRTTVAVSRSSSIAVSKSKRQVKRPRITEDEASTKLGLLKQRELVSVAGEVRIRNTWKLRSDDEAYDKSSEQTKLRTSTPATNTPSDSTKDTVKMTNSNEQGRCAYHGCTQPARYKCRCAEHNGRARCSLPDCVKFAHSGGKCIAHGGGALCTEAGCTTRARSKGKCYAHGGGIVCSHPECTTRAKTKGNALRTVDGLSVHIQDVPTVRISGANARRMTK